MENTNKIITSTFEVLVTTGCNLKCSYCFEKKERGKKINIDKLIEFLKENPYIKRFSLFGGEPLLALDVIEKVIDYIENSELDENQKNSLLDSARGIITNGTLIPKFIKRIKKNKLHLQISLDGCKESHDLNRVFPNGNKTFDLLMESIKLCNENDIQYSLHGVLSKNTVKYLIIFVNYFF